MRVVARHVEDPRPCSYLPAEQARIETFVLRDVSPDELEALLVRGFRRFGPFYFRPRCAPCGECVSLRIPVATFAPTTAQRRAARRCARFRREESAPRCDDERLELHARWHAGRVTKRGWEDLELDPESYAVQFATPHPCAREVTFRDEAAGGRLVGVGLWDVTPSARSAVYFFSDPEYAKESLGTANVVLGVEDARAAGASHVYLGYRVAGCPSVAYKARYGPHELLFGRPGLREEPRWVRAADVPQRGT